MESALVVPPDYWGDPRVVELSEIYQVQLPKASIPICGFKYRYTSPYTASSGSSSSLGPSLYPLSVCGFAWRRPSPWMMLDLSMASFSSRSETTLVE